MQWQCGPDFVLNLKLPLNHTVFESQEAAAGEAATNKPAFSKYRYKSSKDCASVLFSEMLVGCTGTTKQQKSLILFLSSIVFVPNPILKGAI